MRADGRRLGRIIGQLQDIEVLVEAYTVPEEYRHPVIVEHLLGAWEDVRKARAGLESAAYMINEETPRDE